MSQHSQRASPVLCRRVSPVQSRRASPVNLKISDELLRKIQFLENENNDLRQFINTNEAIQTQEASQTSQASQASQKSFTSNIIQNEINEHKINEHKINEHKINFAQLQHENKNTNTNVNSKLDIMHSTAGMCSPLSPKIKQQIETAKKEDKENIQNGWDVSALKSLNNWYQSFKEQSYCYQYILDKNRKISTRLSLISIASSSILSIFAGFKLWNSSNESYQSGSDVAMMISNFIVAAITTASKRYIDDQRNEQIRTHVENIDAFLGKIYAQVYIDAKYRINAKDFIKDNVDEYTNLMISAPNLSIQELTEAKKNYRKFNKIEENINKKESAKRYRETKERELKREFENKHTQNNNINKNDTEIDIDSDNNIDFIDYKDNKYDIDNYNTARESEL